MARLRLSITNVFDDMVADHHIKAGIVEWQRDACDLLECIAFVQLPVVADIHGIDLAAQLRVMGKPVRDAAGAGTDLQQAERLRASYQIQKPGDFLRLPGA